MKGKELIEMIKEYELEEFEMKISFTEKDNSEWGITVRSFSIDKVPGDIGHSDKICVLGVTEER